MKDVDIRLFKEMSANYKKIFYLIDINYIIKKLIDSSGNFIDSFDYEKISNDVFTKTN